MSSKNEVPAKAPTKKAAKAKNGIGQLAEKLLVETDQGYAEIVAAIQATHPDAKTTARSIASIACNLRKKGVEVPMRRSSKKEG